MTEPAEKIPVTVVVPKREEFKGYWSLGRSRPGRGVFFETGRTDIEVTAAELAELKEDEAAKHLVVVEYSPAERAARLAAQAEDDAKKAEDAAASALEEAQRKADAAAKAKADAKAAADAAAAKAGKGKKSDKPAE